jgi:hypothetical protein
VIPASTNKVVAIGSESETGNGAFVTGELVKQLTGLHRPHMDIERIWGTSTNNFTTGIHGERAE